jgi:NADPH:quinone reductase-like Zn-dependent oxidoreductase
MPYLGVIPLAFRGARTAGLPDMTGRTVLITGAGGGIGLITAGEFGRVGARVVLSPAWVRRRIIWLMAAQPDHRFRNGGSRS